MNESVGFVKDFLRCVQFSKMKIGEGWFMYDSWEVAEVIAEDGEDVGGDIGGSSMRLKVIYGKLRRIDQHSKKAY